MSSDPIPKKSLGQHWLEDQASLERIVELGDLSSTDCVVEIGPGKGALTELLVKEAGQVVAIEFDNFLASTLKQRVKADNLKVSNQDCLEFDYSSLPPGYSVIANIPYYLTSNLLRVLSETDNPPESIVLLIQKEVAERVAASPGNMSILGVTVQYYYQAELDIVVSASKFNPSPKVDSQVVVLNRRPEPLFGDIQTDLFFKIIKAGFSQKRKKLKSSLSAGLSLPKITVQELLGSADVSGDLRPQQLSLDQWHQIYKVLSKVKD